jgi:hypothetical protein
MYFLCQNNIPKSENSAEVGVCITRSFVHGTETLCGSIQYLLCIWTF